MSNLTKYKEDLKNLIKTGKLINHDFDFRRLTNEEKQKLSEENKETLKKLNSYFEKNYQSWYTEAAAVIRQLIPDRLDEFVQLYKGDGKRKVIDGTSYTIQDWMNGVRSSINRSTGAKVFDDFVIIVMRFQTQLQILSSAEKRFNSSLLDIRQLIQSDLFDSEIDVSKELLKKGFSRAAGAICGVIIEKHLAQVCSNHNIVLAKKNPTISDFNDNLKSKDVIEVSTWRFIQRLGDLRNLCAHSKDKEPTKEDASELIDGTDKLIKTVF